VPYRDEDLGMTRVPDQDQPPTFGLAASSLEMYFRDERACRVDHR
jgi:hypothetical protein